MTSTKSKATCIGWCVDSDGRSYKVITYFEGGGRDVYQAGNHPRDSMRYLPADDPEADSPAQLREYARKTADETAREHGVSPNNVFEDTDEID